MRQNFCQSTKSGKYFVEQKKQMWFNDRNFRTAIDWAIDRDGIVNNIANGLGKPLFTAESLNSIFLNEKLVHKSLPVLSYSLYSKLFVRAIKEPQPKTSASRQHLSLPEMIVLPKRFSPFLLKISVGV